MKEKHNKNLYNAQNKKVPVLRKDIEIKNVGKFNIKFIFNFCFDFEFRIKRLFCVNYFYAWSKLCELNVVFFIFQRKLN